MKVKKYKAPTMPEAMKQIRRELGGDAIILNSREVESGGFLGFFGKKYLEVVAAVDPDSIPRRKIAPAQTLASQTNQAPGFSEEMDQGNARKEAVRQPERTPHAEWAPPNLRELTNGIRKIYDSSYPGPIQEAYERLRDQEVEPNLIEPFMQPLLKEWYINDESLSAKDTLSLLSRQIKKRLQEQKGKPHAYEKKYLLLAGPTGVGKTTTLAKLAAKAKLEDHKKIAFITADTYRIAAVDQLKAYADILNVPIEVAYTKEDFLNAKKRFSDRDLVFVDTAGRNFREPSFIDEMKKLISFDEEIQTWLVLSLTAKYSDLCAVFRAFNELAPTQSLFTKVDETQSYGTAFNFWIKEGIVPAYFTNGQNVPDDLITASPGQMAALLTGVEEDE